MQALPARQQSPRPFEGLLSGPSPFLESTANRRHSSTGNRPDAAPGVSVITNMDADTSEHDFRAKVGEKLRAAIWCDANAGPSYLIEKWTVALIRLGIVPSRLHTRLSFVWTPSF